jgi:hypothetical protein
MTTTEQAERLAEDIVNRLRDELPKVGEPESVWTTVMCDDIREAADEIEQLRADAARYRWLKDRFLGADFDWDEAGGQILMIEWSGGAVWGCLDLTVDAAMQPDRGVQEGGR